MKLGTWNVRSLYRAGSLKAAAKELGRYKLDVVGVLNRLRRWGRFRGFISFPFSSLARLSRNLH